MAGDPPPSVIHVKNTSLLSTLPSEDIFMQKKLPLSSNPPSPEQNSGCGPFLASISYFAQFTSKIKIYHFRPSQQRGRMGKDVVTGFNPTLTMLLRSWIKRFTMIISAWWLRTSSKFSGKEFKEITGTFRSLETPQQVRIPPRTK